MEAIRLAIDSPNWVSFVNSHPDAIPFHSPAWSQLLAECYGYRSFVVVVKDAEGGVSAGIPVVEIRSWLTGRRWVSLPFSDYCPPLYRNKQSLESLLDHLVRLRSEQSVARIEIRWQMPQSTSVQTCSEYVMHTLDLSAGSEAVFEKVNKMHRRNMCRAEREGVIVRKSMSKSAVDAFYTLQIATRRRYGLPVQPKRFFDLMWERLIDKGLGFVLLAYKDNLPAAGGVFLKYKGTLTYKYGASDDRNRKIRANHRLVWTAIQWACENGFRLVDFGRTNVSNDGLRAFKNGWATEEIQLPYSIIADRPPAHSSEAAKLLLAQVIRHSPAVVCRATGELLYRHFG